MTYPSQAANRGRARVLGHRASVALAGNRSDAVRAPPCPTVGRISAPRAADRHRASSGLTRYPAWS